MDFNLAEEFRKLAADDSWPWKAHDEMYNSIRQESVVTKGLDPLCLMTHWKDTDHFQTFIVESPLVRAKLALMVVSRTYEVFASQADYAGETINRKPFDKALQQYGILPSDYQNVKARVEKAEQ